jgi:hypothetical protein
MATSPDIDGFVSIFHDGSLNSEAEAHSALDSLATCIVDDDFEPFLNKLLDPSSHTTPLALELILSCKLCLRCDFINPDLSRLLATECGQLFANWLLTHFPLQPKYFYLSSTAFILAKLSLYLLFECSFDRDLLGKLRICRLRVENAPDVLKTLSEAVFPNVSESYTVKDEIDLNLEHLIIRKSRRQRKGTKGSAKSFNPQTEKALAVFNFGIPSDSLEAEGQITAILNDQQDVLKVFILFYGIILD